MEMPQAHPRCRLSFRGFHSPGQKLGDLRGLAKKKWCSIRKYRACSERIVFFQSGQKKMLTTCWQHVATILHKFDRFSDDRP